MAYTLDTAASTDRLTAAGLDANAARAIVTEMASVEADLVTKADLTAAIAALEIGLVRWGIALAAASVGILFALLRFTQ